MHILHEAICPHTKNSRLAVDRNDVRYVDGIPNREKSFSHVRHLRRAQPICNDCGALQGSDYGSTQLAPGKEKGVAWSKG